GNDDIRLERRKTTLDDLGTESRNVLVGGELLGVRHLPGTRARRAAMRPVHVDAVARRSAEELVDRNVERLAFEVQERVLDPAAGYGCRGRSTVGKAASPASTSARARAQSSSSSTLKPSWPFVKNGATTRPSRVPVCETTRVHAISSALFCT